MPFEKQPVGSVDLAVRQGIDIEFTSPSLGYELVGETQALRDKATSEGTLGQSIEKQLFGHEVRIAQA